MAVIEICTFSVALTKLYLIIYVLCCVLRERNFVSEKEPLRCLLWNFVRNINRLLFLWQQEWWWAVKIITTITITRRRHRRRLCRQRRLLLWCAPCGRTRRRPRSCGSKKTTKWHKVCACRATRSTCTTSTSAPKMAWRPSTPPVLARWAHLHTQNRFKGFKNFENQTIARGNHFHSDSWTFIISKNIATLPERKQSRQPVRVWESRQKVAKQQHSCPESP